jgi:hypothetical protein
MTRLKLQDIKDLMSCKDLLDGMIAARQRTNSPGAGTEIAALLFMVRFVCDLYNRAEPHWLRYQERRKAQPDQVAATQPDNGPGPELAAPAPEPEPGK